LKAASPVSEGQEGGFFRLFYLIVIESSVNQQSIDGIFRYRAILKM
jgi:hypothetical protein